MKIGVDVDGVLADFNEKFVQRVITVTGEDRFPARPFDIPCWNYPQHYGYSAEQVSAVWQSIKTDREFWGSLSPYPGVGEVLRVLRMARQHGHDIYFVTARMGHEAKLQTETWLWNNGMTNPTVLISGHKMRCALAVGLDCYIDDHVQNCFEVADHCRTYIQNRPWNSISTAEWQNARAISTADVLRVDHIAEMIADIAQDWRD
jgi:5'(3')-deoxyribonucleotidase